MAATDRGNPQVVRRDSDLPLPPVVEQRIAAGRVGEDGQALKIAHRAGREDVRPLNRNPSFARLRPTDGVQSGAENLLHGDNGDGLLIGRNCGCALDKTGVARKKSRRIRPCRRPSSAGLGVTPLVNLGTELRKGWIVLVVAGQLGNARRLDLDGE